MTLERSQLPLFDDELRIRERQSPRARHIRIELRPPREVLLVYPRWVSRAEALRFLHSKQAWIRDKFAALADVHPEPQPPRWDGADQLPLRGRWLPVRVEPARLRQPAVRFDDELIRVFAPPQQLQDARRLETVLSVALRHQARLDALRYLEAEAPRLGVRYTRLRLNDPRRQWGSCTPDGVVSLSWRLVMAPPEVFRYVVVHELCHLVHHDHSERFWCLVARQMPDFETHKRWLREQGHGLHLQSRRFEA